jgi:hypothetical protein
MDMDTETENEIIQTIVTNTNYTEEKAKQLLQEADGNYKKVIRDFILSPPKKSINQQIYSQMRHRLDESMREYTERKEKENLTN